MAQDPSHPVWVKLDQALDLVMSQRGHAVIPITAGDTSMRPLLHGGDAVLVVPLASVPAPGDLLLFRQNDYFVVHRYLGPVRTRDGREGLRTRGDGRNDLDPLVTDGSVRARVIALRRAGAWRSLEGAPAAIFARLLAWHDFFWAGAGVVGRRLGLKTVVAAVDSGLLRLTVPLVYKAAHRRRVDLDGLIE